MNLLLRAVRRRLRRVGGDTGSLPLAMLVIIIGLGLVAVLLPISMNMITSTDRDGSRSQQVAAAEAGIDAALGLVRSATDSAGAGDVTGLPCTTNGALTGTVAGSGSQTYSVTIGYYTQDPTGQPDSWLATYTAGGSGTGMLCATGSGTYYPPTKEQVPSYVVITSTGSDGSGSRTLRATYVVQTSNANIAGGTIYVFPSSSSNFCMDAGSPQPVAGAAVLIQPCDLPVVQQQAWAYNTDLSITLVSSVTATYPNGLCLASTGSVGSAITLQPCAAIGNAPYLQKWSVDNVAHLQDSKSDSSDINGHCINVASQGAGVALTLQNCAGGVTDTKQTWVPSPDVGAGMAGAPNNQLVDFQQFGRCLDVTNTDVNSAFLIAYTCKQNPNPAKVLWNQKFVMNAQNEIVTNNGSAYCLTSPLKAYSYKNGTGGPYVVVTPCPASPTSAVTWTQYGSSDSDGNVLPTLQKYTVQDANGMCLSLTPGNTDAYNNQYSKVIVEACNGTPVQKWNASPDVRTPVLGDLHEITSGS